MLLGIFISFSMILVGFVAKRYHLGLKPCRCLKFKFLRKLFALLPQILSCLEK